MMNLQHRVQINIADRSGQKKAGAWQQESAPSPKTFESDLRRFLTPGTSVRNIEIHEMRGGADDDE